MKMNIIDFPENNSHMPYACEGVAACCVQVGRLWKVHVSDGGPWSRLDTGIPEDGTECSPYVWYDPVKKQHDLSFIAGGYEGGYRFYLYNMYDVFGSRRVERVCESEIGLVAKNFSVIGGRKGPVFIHRDNYTRVVEIKEAEYYYRVSVMPSNPNSLVVSWQDTDGNVLTNVINPESGKAWELLCDGLPTYKPLVYGNVCYTAEKHGEHFEDRRIVHGTPSLADVDFDNLCFARRTAASPLEMADFE